MKLKKLLNTNYNQIFQIRLLKNGTPTFCDYFNKLNDDLLNSEVVKWRLEYFKSKDLYSFVVEIK